jgi:transcription antitermination factor NusG
MTVGTGTIQRGYTKAARRRQRKAVAMTTAPVVRSADTEVVRHQTLATKALIEPENLRWYGLNVKSNKEEKVIQVLDLCGIPAAIPTIARHRVRRGKVYRWRSPICGGLVMVGFPGTAQIEWHELTRFELVYNFINHNGVPRQIPWRASYQEDGKIKKGGAETLLSDLEAVRRGAAKFLRLRPAYAKGETVRIDDGPFAGHSGAVESSTDVRVSVLLMLFGRLSPVTVAADSVSRAA